MAQESARFASLEDFASKIEWEGGITEAVSYGLKASDVPAGYPDLEILWEELCRAQQVVEYLEEKITKILEPHGLG